MVWEPLSHLFRFRDGGVLEVKSESLWDSTVTRGDGVPKLCWECDHEEAMGYSHQADKKTPSCWP